MKLLPIDQKVLTRHSRPIRQEKLPQRKVLVDVVLLHKDETRRDETTQPIPRHEVLVMSNQNSLKLNRFINLYACSCYSLQSHRDEVGRRSTENSKGRGGSRLFVGCRGKGILEDDNGSDQHRIGWVVWLQGDFRWGNYFIMCIPIYIPYIQMYRSLLHVDEYLHAYCRENERGVKPCNKSKFGG